MPGLQTGEDVKATIIAGMSLIQDGIECMAEEDPNRGIGARLSGQRICDNALSTLSEALGIAPDGELCSASSAAVFAMREVYPEAFSWYLAQERH